MKIKETLSRRSFLKRAAAAEAAPVAFPYIVPASALGLDPAGLGIAGRPPLATSTEGRPAAEVSLSHHGRFVAFACRLPSTSACCPGAPGW